MAHYFVADVHAGLGGSRSAECFIAWLDAVAPDAEAIWLLGDTFDFWFEYRRAVPPGYETLLDKFRELTGMGVELHFFSGNHDMWTLDYLARVCGMTVHRRGFAAEIYGNKIYLDHGDRQSIHRVGERLMQRIFRWKFARAIGRMTVRPEKMWAFGRNWSQANRAKCAESQAFKGEGEGVVRFAEKYGKHHPVDLFVFGHLHAPAEYCLPNGAMLYVLGDWISAVGPVYGRLDGGGFRLQNYR